MVREEFGIVQPQCKNVHKASPPFAPFLLVSEIAQVPISFSVSVFGKILVMLVLKSIGKLSWTPTGMGSFLAGVTLVCWGTCRHVAPASSCPLQQAKYIPRKHIPHWHTCAGGSPNWCQGFPTFMVAPAVGKAVPAREAPHCPWWGLGLSVLSGQGVRRQT